MELELALGREFGLLDSGVSPVLRWSNAMQLEGGVGVVDGETERNCTLEAVLEEHLLLRGIPNVDSTPVERPLVAEEQPLFPRSP